jgi:hypothetical protein
MLTIVQDDEQALLPQVFDQRGQNWFTRLLPNLYIGSHDLGNQRRIRQCGKLHNRHAIGVFPKKFTGYLQG